MQAKEQIREWEKRLIDVDRRFADVCRDAGINAPFFTQWKTRNSSFPEIALLQAYIEEVGFEHACSFVARTFDPSSSVHIWCRVEKKIREYESLKIEA
jgi:hypothetical protein